MTVRELINELKHFEPSTRVMFSYNYGDQWKTEVAQEVETVDEQTVFWSEYHSMYVISSGEEDLEGAKRIKEVVILGR